MIKQNTGGGKTLVGLLIGQSSLNEGFGPVVYLVPDTTLIKQVVVEAPNGIGVTTDRHDERFLAGGAILVSTFEKLVNGRSALGAGAETGHPAGDRDRRRCALRTGGGQAPILSDVAPRPAPDSASY